MFKFFIFAGIFVVASALSLQDVTKTININVNSVDIDGVVAKTQERFKNYDFKKLKKDKQSVQYHKNRVSNAQKNLKILAGLKAEMEINYLDIEQLKQSIKKAKQHYDREINRVYRKNKHLERYSYLVIVAKDGEDYKKNLQNYILDKFAIKKYDQTTTLTKSLASASMQSVIKTQKDFGQKSVDTIYEYLSRASGTTIKVIKVIQNPFVKSKSNSTNSDQENQDNNDFDDTEDSSVQIFDLRESDLDQVGASIDSNYKLSMDDIESFLSTVKPKVDILQYKKDFFTASKEIKDVLQKLEKTHLKEMAKVASLKSEYDMKVGINKDIQTHLDKVLKKTQKLLKPYHIAINAESIGKITIVTPKIYSETVQYKEELDFIRRKVKAYVSRINISDLKQSETLVDFTDLSTTTKIKQKMIEFKDISLLPFLDKNNKVGLFIFSSIQLKDKVKDSDLLDFKFKYDDMKFIPVQQGYKTIFVAQKEVTLGIVKEFLEKNRFKTYFDKFCIEDSFLPEEAKDFKNVDEEYYQYPAVCFKVDKIDKFIKWVRKKTKRDIVIPEASTWAYVATNGKTTDYCWGDTPPEELAQDDNLPENIYLEDLDNDTKIEKTGSFPKSKLGLYDMCGNVFELVKQDGELGYKGNSFSSYIELSNQEAELYTDDVNPTLGIRLFYIKDLADE